MLSSGANVIIWSYYIIWDKMSLSGMKRYHLGQNVIIRDEMLSSGPPLSSGTKCYLELMLSSGMHCYHLEFMLSSGAYVIIWS
jgi:hypothetical protein